MNKAQSLLISVAEEIIQKESGVVFIRPEPTADLVSFARKTAHLLAVQGFFPAHQHLSSLGISSACELQNDAISNALFVGGRYRNENLHVFSSVLNKLSQGGFFLCAFPNDLGASRYEKELQSLYNEPLFSVQKSKCRVFGIHYFDKTKCLFPDTIPETNTLSVFNEGKLDAGSALLAKTISSELSGDIYEPCSGAGALSYALLKQSSAIRSLKGIEAEWNAVQHAQKTCLDSRAEFLWGDATKPFTPYPTVVLNPPFHNNHGPEQTLGLRCIKSAADSVAPGGTLFVVQNEFLPYRKELPFANKIELLNKEAGFIVWKYTKTL